MPADLRLVSSLQHLDLSSNTLRSLPEGCLPSNLVEVVLTGCSLHALPQQLKLLPCLQRLFLGANRCVSGSMAWKREAACMHATCSSDARS